ncbi:copper resistance protein NlpE N-terminal domain-containing protein [Halomonas sp. V046]|uniref:copper resistance protein NlpE N-terminal domain-containing protein n=1 Tax=Halomonas sp. V046 TaxID=3459611 RepID=UPI00404420A6
MARLFVVGLGGVTLALVGCASGTGGADSAGVIEPETRFVGNLPCDDCRVIRADLTLHRDAESGQPKQFFLHQTHVDAVGGNVTSTSWGDWQLMPADDAMFYRLESGPQPMVLRLEDDGQQLGWVGLKDSHDDDVSYELRRAALMR